MNHQYKVWIDSATYEQLLSKWRFAPSGDPMFVGDYGRYYAETMKRKRAELSDNGVNASKAVGWEK